MKNIYRIGFVLMLPLLWAGCKKDDNNPKPKTPPNTTPDTIYKAPANFRVVGYMLSEDIASGAIANFNMARVNYLNITFGDTTNDGTVPAVPNLVATITAAHNVNAKVLASVGGDFIAKDFYSSEGARTKFIANLMASVDQYHFDGVDVDLEGDYLNKYYEIFMQELSAAVWAKGKVMTAAVATWETDGFTDKSLTYFDYLNVMSYDDTGPWAPRDAGPHSPYSMAVSDLDFWTNTRGIAANKLNLGVPFYGYAFAAKGPVDTYDYAQIIQMVPDGYKTDQLSIAGNKTLYYNGIPTIEKKTTLAMQSAGGVMIWELMYDTNDNTSLLNAIDKTANPGNK